jgi:hypothetical protein
MSGLHFLYSSFCLVILQWLYLTECTAAVYPSHYLFSGYLVWQHYTAQHYQDWSEASSNSILRCMYVCMYSNVTKVEYLLLSLEALVVLEPVVNRCYTLYLYYMNKANFLERITHKNVYSRCVNQV